jgi:hypothetical protein
MVTNAPTSEVSVSATLLPVVGNLKVPFIMATNRIQFVTNFIKILSADGRTDGQTDMVILIYVLLLHTVKSTHYNVVRTICFNKLYYWRVQITKWYNVVIETAAHEENPAEWACYDLLRW